MKMKTQLKIALLASCGWGICSSAARSEWTSFRAGGESHATGNLPTEWNPQEGIAWQLELPGYGQSTPLVFKDNVYVTAVEGTMKEECVLLCYELATGKEQWRYEFKSANPSPSNYMASRAAPTPVVDENGLYAFFETGDVIAINLEGEKIWHRDLTAEYGAFDNNHGLGASPAQNGTHLFLNIEHRGPSYLLAVEKQSGETAWKIDRGSGSSWSSPIVADVNGQEQVIVSSGGSVAGYDVRNGGQLWSLDGLDGNTVPSPTLVDSKLFIGARLPEFAAEGSVRSNCCIDLSKLGESGPQVLWRAEKAMSDYCSPLPAGGVTYFVNKGGVLYCVDSQSGKLNYVKRLGTDCWGTPIVAGELVYFFGKDGKTQVLKASSEFQLVASNQLWEEANPPKPERYVELAGGSHSHGGDSKVDTGDGKPKGGPGGGMMAALMSGDANGDGILQAAEISSDFQPMLARVDSNQDGSLDAAEIKAMTESFAARRANSQASARDPIVYGAAAANGAIVIRTGTRLYCVR